MTAFAIASAVMAVGVSTASRLNAADIDLARTLKGIEDHYNRVQTLELTFTQKYTFQKRLRTEKGELFLRKPGRMRWQYTAPAGKLFVSDGKFMYAYFPNENRVEKTPFKETEDMRAPLAFLLGRLNFQDDFREFRTEPDRDNIFITALPKSDKLLYTEVKFLVSPDFVIHWLSVSGQDGSTNEFVFENEKKNPPIPDTMFHFTPPPGAEFTDNTPH
jgi:outer membrane lipoprotein carrier protein